jgi:hypothetical protein
MKYYETLLGCPTRCVGRHLNKQMVAAMVQSMVSAAAETQSLRRPWPGAAKDDVLPAQTTCASGSSSVSADWILSFSPSLVFSFLTKDYIESTLSSVAPSTLIRLTLLSRRKNTARPTSETGHTIPTTSQTHIGDIIKQSNDLRIQHGFTLPG